MLAVMICHIPNFKQLFHLCYIQQYTKATFILDEPVLCLREMKKVIEKDDFASLWDPYHIALNAIGREIATNRDITEHFFYSKGDPMKATQGWKSSMSWKLARTSTMNMTLARTVETTQTGTLPAILTARNIFCRRCVKSMVSLQYGFIRTSRMWRKTQSTVQVLVPSND